MSQDPQLRGNALWSVKDAILFLELEDHDGPHPLEDVLEKLRDVEKTLGSVLDTDPDASPETLEE